MTTNVTYRVIKKSLHIRIKVTGYDASIFDTGIPIKKKEDFLVKEQMCRFPKVQDFMVSTATAINDSFMPGATPESLWADFNKKKQVTTAHTVEMAFEYYDTYAQVVEDTKSAVRQVKKEMKQAKLLHKPIQELTAAMLREFSFRLITGDLKASTVRRKCSNLVFVLNFYVQAHSLPFIIPSGFYKGIKADGPADDEYIIWSELEALLKAPVEDKSDRYGKDLWCLMALTGMAIGDLLAFNPNKNISTDGKWLHYRRRKTKAKCTVPLLGHAKEIIARYEWPIEISKRTIQNKSEGIVSKLVGRKMKSHTARKSFGTVALEFGYSIESVAKFLGHSSPAITARIYSKVTEAKIERETENLPPAIKQLMEL